MQRSDMRIVLILFVFFLCLPHVASLSAAGMNDPPDGQCDVRTKICTGRTETPARATVFPPSKATKARGTPPAPPILSKDVPKLPVEGAFSKGPLDAPVTIIAFFDFQCPFCARVAPVIDALFDAYPGKIHLMFKHFPLPIHPDAPGAHEAALAAGEQGKFWEMHDLVLADQQAVGRDALMAHAESLGLDRGRFVEALDQHRFRPAIDRDIREAKALGVVATPTFFINGKKLTGARDLAAFKTAIEQALGMVPEENDPEERGEPPVMVQEVRTDGSPVRGAAEGPITIIEFSDFECPFCARVLPTLADLMKAYPDEIRWVFKHFPLDFHAKAPLAHEAALAASEQGKFWEMHDRIFSNQSAMGREDLIRAAREIGLEVDRFLADLDSRRFRPTVEADKEEGFHLGVSGTPTFFINGRRKVGAIPLSEFQQAIEAEIRALPDGVRERIRQREIEKREREPLPLSAQGPREAPVRVQWFTDLGSPLTPKAFRLVRQVSDAYPGRLQWIVKHRPMEFRGGSFLLHEAALAAGEQGKFWEMQEMILASPSEPTEEDLIGYASQLGLEPGAFASSLSGGVYRPMVERDLDEAKRREVRGTPVFFVNGKRIDGIQPLTMFREIIDGELRQTGVGRN